MTLIAAKLKQVGYATHQVGKVRAVGALCCWQREAEETDGDRAYCGHSSKTCVCVCVCVWRRVVEGEGKKEHKQKEATVGGGT